MAKKILVAQSLPSSGQEKIERTARKYGYRVVFCTNTGEAMNEAEGTEILYGFSTALARASKELKWMCTTSAGVNSQLIPGAIGGEDVLLTNSSGSYGATIAEHLILMILTVLRRLPDYEREMTAGKWRADYPMQSIFGSRITVLGTGDLGATFADRVRGFRPKSVAGLCRSGEADRSLFDRVGTLADLDGLLPETDILVLCLPETPETIGVLSRERLALLPKNAVVANVGRGSAIDQRALIDALNEERIAGAALDVMEHEPIPEGDPLWTAKNVFLTPHIAGQWTLDYTVEKSVDLFCEDLENYCEGRPLKRLVDRERGY